MTNILVTGATGFLGSALTKSLKLDPSNTVITIERDKTPERPSAGDHTVRGDLTNFDLVRRTIGDYEIQQVYHMAAQSIVRICASDPLSAYQTNVMGTVNLLEACRTVGQSTVESILVSTSDKAFGHAPAPYNENTPLQPKFTYEATKACQDIVAQNYFHNYGVPTKVARCSNIYGPGDPNMSRLIPNTIRRVLSGEAPQIYKDVAGYIREFIYIDDVINAFKMITEKADPGEVFCVGGTIHLSVKELVERILDLCDSTLEIEYPERNVNFKEIETQYIDASKLLDLGWYMRWNLSSGLRKTIEYYKDV